MEIKNIKKLGKYNLSGMLKFETDQGLVEIKATEALEIAYTLFDYCNVDFQSGTLYEVETRLLDDVEIERN